MLNLYLILLPLLHCTNQSAISGSFKLQFVKYLQTVLTKRVKLVSRKIGMSFGGGRGPCHLVSPFPAPLPGFCRSKHFQFAYIQTK